MKKLFALGVILTGLCLALPWVAGQLAAQELDKLVLQLNANPQYSAQWDSYQQGWLGSSGTLTVTMNSLVAEGVSPAALITVELDHGPIIFAAGVGLGWYKGRAAIQPPADDSLESLITPEQPGPIWTLTFNTRLNGVTSFTDVIYPAQVHFGAETMTLSRYDGQGQLTPKGELVYRGGLPRVILSAEGARVELDGLAVSANFILNQNTVDQRFAPGRLDLQLDQGSGQGDDLDKFSVSQLKIGLINTLSPKQVNEKRGSTASSQFVLRFDQMQLDDSLIEALNVDVAISNISLEFLKRYIESMNALNNSKTAQLASFDVLALASEALFPHGPELQVNDFSFKSNKGDLSLHAQATVPATEGQKLHPFTVFQSLEIKAHCKADKTLAMAMAVHEANKSSDNGSIAPEDQGSTQVQQQAQAQLAALVAQGYLIEQGTSYIADFTFIDGAASLNGNPVPLSLF